MIRLRAWVPLPLLVGLVLAGSTVATLKARPAWLFSAARAWVYRGGAHECNICGRTFGRFERGPQTQMEQQCPFCGSKPRHRTAHRYFRERSDLFAGTPRRMLHIAPEKFLVPVFTSIPNLDYLSGDLDPVAAGAMVKVDVTDIQFPANTFDVIYCSHVLEHVPDDLKAMRELARVLTPGGWAILAVPIREPEHTFEDPAITTPDTRNQRYGQFDHVRSYGPDFVDRLEASGFDVTVDRFASTLSAEDVQRFGLSREDLYLSRKTLR